MEFLRSLGFFTYGKVIPGLMIHGRPAPYPVLNERAIRAGAGLIFAAGFFAFFQALYLGDFFFLKLLVPFLFFDFLMKTVVGINFSPVSRLANWIVRSQAPEYVGAVQKRFAWSIGLVLSFTMLLLLFVFEVRGLPNLVVCSLCLTFMFMESAFGVCVGCKLYNWLLKKRILEMPEYKPACPGNVCAIE
jgi:hypothetical protein